MAATILCVDDDRNFCQILSRAFRAEGYGVEMAHDGEVALAKVRECAPDLVTLDILLPKRDGFEVLEAIRKEGGSRGQTPVVLLSGCTSTPNYQRRADRLHADAVLKKPVPLKEILELVAKQISAHTEPDRTRPRLEVVTRSKKKKPNGKIALSGSFEDVPFAALLHHLHGLRATGVLQLQSGKKKKLLQVDKGHPVAVRSNLVDECLGNLLLATGKITSEVLHESIQRMQSGEGPQGQILIAMHMLDQEDLAMALRNQAEEKLFEIFSWRTGSFRFKKGTRLRDANALTLKVSPANLVMDGVSFRLSIGEIDRFLGERAERYPARGESPFYRFQDIQLDSAEEGLLNGLDGTRPLSELLDEDETTRRALYALITLEMIELREVPVPARSAPVRTAPRPKPRPAQPTRQAPRGGRGRRRSGPRRPSGGGRPTIAPRRGSASSWRKWRGSSGAATTSGSSGSRSTPMRTRFAGPTWTWPSAPTRTASAAPAIRSGIWPRRSSA